MHRSKYTMHDEHIHGMPITEVLDMRDRVSTYWHKRQGRRYPLEEYRSAAHLAIAEASARYDPTRGTPFPEYLVIHMHQTMMNVRVWEAGKGNLPQRRANSRQRAERPDYTVTHRPPEWAGWHGIPTAPQGEHWTFLGEVCQFLATHTPTDKQLLFVQHILGEDTVVLAKQCGYDRHTLDVTLAEIRCSLFVWSGYRLPGTRTYSREWVAEVQRRHAAGETYRSIARTLHCAPQAVRIALAHPPVPPTGTVPPGTVPTGTPGAHSPGALVAPVASEPHRPLSPPMGRPQAPRRQEGEGTAYLTREVSRVASDQRGTVGTRPPRGRRQQGWTQVIRYSLDTYPPQKILPPTHAMSNTQLSRQLETETV